MEKLFRPPVLIKDVVGVLSEFFHVRSYQHLAKFDEVAMLLIVNFDDTPRIGPPANLTAVWSDNDLIGTDHSKRNLARNFLRLCYGLFIFVLVGGRLISKDFVICYIRKNLMFG